MLHLTKGTCTYNSDGTGGHRHVSLPRFNGRTTFIVFKIVRFCGTTSTRRIYKARKVEFTIPDIRRGVGKFSVRFQARPSRFIVNNYGTTSPLFTSTFFGEGVGTDRFNNLLRYGNDELTYGGRNARLLPNARPFQGTYLLYGRRNFFLLNRIGMSLTAGLRVIAAIRRLPNDSNILPIRRVMIAVPRTSFQLVNGPLIGFFYSTNGADKIGDTLMDVTQGSRLATIRTRLVMEFCGYIRRGKASFFFYEGSVPS